jgi:hypothetical protein
MTKKARKVTTRIKAKTMTKKIRTKTATTNDGDMMGGGEDDEGVAGVDEKKEKTEGGDGGGSGRTDHGPTKKRRKGGEGQVMRKDMEGVVASSTDAVAGLVDLVPPKSVSDNGAEVDAENNDATSAGHENSPPDGRDDDDNDRDGGRASSTNDGGVHQFLYLNGVTSLSWDRHSRTLLAGAIGDRNLRLMDNT